jgi:hypothetical protein
MMKMLFRAIVCIAACVYGTNIGRAAYYGYGSCRSSPCYPYYRSPCYGVPTYGGQWCASVPGVPGKPPRTSAELDAQIQQLQNTVIDHENRIQILQRQVQPSGS